MGNKGLAAALAGLARGGASHVKDKNEQARKMEMLQQRFMLEQQLRQAIEGQRQEGYNQRATQGIKADEEMAKAKLLAELREKLVAARGKAQGHGFGFGEEIGKSADPDALRGQLMDIEGLIGARGIAKEGRAEKRSEKQLKLDERRARRLESENEPNLQRFEAGGRQWTFNPRSGKMEASEDVPTEPPKGPSSPPFGSFSSRVQQLSSPGNDAYGNREEALKIAARELFGIEPPDTYLRNEFGNLRGEKEVYDMLSDHYRVMGSARR